MDGLIYCYMPDIFHSFFVCFSLSLFFFFGDDVVFVFLT